MFSQTMGRLSRWRRDERFALMRSSLLSVMVKAAGLALIMGVSVLLARCLGPAEYGQFAFMQSIAFVLASFATLGFRESANRMVARYAFRRQKLFLSWFILFGILVITLASGVLATLGHNVITHVPALSGKYPFPVSAMLGMVASLALLSFLAPVMVALGRPVFSFTVENIGPRVIVLFAVLLMMAVGMKLSAGAALYLTIAGNLVPALALAAFAFIRFGLPLRPPGRFSAATRCGRIWLGISSCMMTSPIVSLVFSETSIIVLGASAPPRDVALYQIARRLSDLAIVCGSVANYLALTSIARFHAQGRTADLQRTVDIANCLTIVPGLCVLLALLADGNGILRVFGPAFVGAYTATLILSAGRVADQLFGPVLEVLLMTGHHGVASGINIAFAIGNVLANLLLVPLWGPVGAAIATIGVTLLWKASLYAVLRARSPVETCLPVTLMERMVRGVARVQPAQR